MVLCGKPSTFITTDRWSLRSWLPSPVCCPSLWNYCLLGCVLSRFSCSPLLLIFFLQSFPTPLNTGIFLIISSNFPLHVNFCFFYLFFCHLVLSQFLLKTVENIRSFLTFVYRSVVRVDIYNWVLRNEPLLEGCRSQRFAPCSWEHPQGY